MFSKITKGLFCACLVVGSIACADDGDNGTNGTDGTNGTVGTDGVDGTDGVGLPSGDFTFRTDLASAYTQVDRIGMPAINTAVITSKDAYNAGDPAGDLAGASIFPAEITTNVTGLHTALDDDLTGAGLTPCVPATCVAAAAALVIPDTIRIDRTDPAGFPNGRLLADPVMDVTLALVLVVPAELLALAGLPLNPPANDVAFLNFFPYLAPPN
jgi:hypothetical protein